MIKNLWFITDVNYEYFLFAYVISYLIEVISFFHQKTQEVKASLKNMKLCEFNGKSKVTVQKRICVNKKKPMCSVWNLGKDWWKLDHDGIKDTMMLRKWRVLKYIY